MLHLPARASRGLLAALVLTLITACAAPAASPAPAPPSTPATSAATAQPAAANLRQHDLRGPRAGRARSHLAPARRHPECLLRPDARAVPGVQRRLRQVLEGETGQAVTVKQSHGGSGKQARSVIDGLEADVVTLALAYDIDAIARRPADRRRTGRRACRTTARPTPRPSSSWCARAIPKGIKDWDDLAQAGRRGHHAESQDLRRRALELPGGVGLRPRSMAGGTRPRPKSFVTRIFKNVPVLDSGARGSTTTFVAARHRRRADRVGERGLPGARAARAGTSSRSSTPSLSILAEPTVAIVDKVVDKHGTRAVAQAYLEYLYTPRGRRSPPSTTTGRAMAAVASEFAEQFPNSSCSPSTTLRRLAESAEGALRRRRHLRPDLLAGANE